MAMVKSENNEDFMRDLEAQMQYSYMDKAKKYITNKEKELGRKLTFHVTTFGCQMNARDSEKLVGILEDIRILYALLQFLLLLFGYLYEL